MPWCERAPFVLHAIEGEFQQRCECMLTFFKFTTKEIKVASDMLSSPDADLLPPPHR